MVSDDARLMIHPFRTYAAIASRGDGRREALGRVARLMLLLGVFVSLLAAGRLVPFHLVSPSIFWAYVPIAHAIALFAATRAVAERGSFSRAVALHFLGFGPWLALLFAIDALLLFSPNAYAAFSFLLAHGVLPFAVLGALGWGIALTFAFFRAALSLSRARAAAGTAVFYVVYASILVSYFLAVGQLQPLLFQR